MLGLGSSLLQGGALRSIVRSGLQLFYKADRTQAPLGEEQVRNNSFDEISSNLVSNPTFNLGSEEVVNGDFATDSDWTKENGWSIANGLATRTNVGSYTALQQNVLESGKVYQVTFTIDSVTSGEIFGIRLGTNYILSNKSTEETFTGVGVANATTLSIMGNPTFAGSISNISVKEVPNWELLNGATISDNKANIIGDGSSFTSIKQVNVFENNKRYKITADVTITSGLGLKFQDGANNENIGFATTTGVYTFYFTGTSDANLVVGRRTSGTAFDSSVNSISVKQLDPNNRWTVNNDTPSEQTVEIREGSFFIEYDSTATKGTANINVTSAGVLNQKYEIKVVVDSINNDEKLKVQLGNSPHNLSVGTNIFEATSTTSGTLTLGRTDEDDSVTATVSSVSLRAITNSIKDHSRNSNDGILYSGKALDFDGTGDIVELNDANLTGEFTVCTWIKPDTFTSCVVFGDGVDENDNYLNLNWIRLNSATSITVKIAGNSTGYAPITHGGNIAQDEWSRLIVTRGSDNIVRFGINGVLYSPSTTARAGTFDFNLLGRKESTEMNGALADVQVYDKAWTASDVEFDYNNPDKDVFDNSNSSIVVTDCKSLLRLNEGAGDRVYDAAPVLRENLNDLTWIGFVGWSTDGDIASNNGSGSTFTNEILELGKTYQFKCKLSSYTSGEFSLFLGVSNESSRFSGTNEFTFIGVCAGDTVARVKSHNGKGSLLISSLSIKEVKPAESFAILGNKTFLHQQPYIPQYAMSSFSKKMLFDGSNDYVACGSDDSIDNIFSGGGTISCWVSPETDGGADIGNIISKSDGDDEGWVLRVSNDDNNQVGLAFIIESSITDGTWVFGGNDLFSVNKITHVILTYDSSSVSNVPKVYINGVEKSTSSATQPVGTISSDASKNLIIGDAGAGFNKNFDGIIDEVSMFKTILTQAEVLELFNLGSSFDSTGHSKYNLGEEVSNGTFELGSEEVVNGGIDSISNWTFGDGWSLVDGKASLVQVGSPQAGDYLEQEITGLVNGRTYVVSFDLDITSATVTTIGISSTGAFGNIDSSLRFHETSIRKTFTAIYDSSHQSGTKYLRFVGGSNTEFTIDNVSVKEVPNWELRPGWSVNNNTVVYDGTGSQYARIIQTLNTVVGRTYQMTFTLSGLSSGGTVNFGLGRNGAFNGYTQQTYSSNGTYTRIMQAQSIDDDIMVQVNQADANCTVSNISVQEYGLSAYWRNNGADQWDDLSINSNHGTVSGSPTEIFLQEVPFFGKDSLGMFMNKPRLGGLNLNTSGYVNIEDNNDLDFGTGNFTMECWVTAKYENVGSSANVILGLGGNVSQAGSAGLVSFDSNKLGGYVDEEVLSANSTFTEGNWYHVAITRTSGTCKLYIDSVLQTDTETSGGSITNSNAKQIGKDTTTIRGYNGVIDDVRLYSEDLTQNQIKKNYNATKGKHKN